MSGEVSLAGALVELTAKEFDLLLFLASSPRQVFSRQQILTHVWSSSNEWQVQATVTEHVRRLRLTIEADPDRPRRIRTVRGVGYCFEPYIDRHGAPPLLGLARPAEEDRPPRCREALPLRSWARAGRAARATSVGGTRLQADRIAESERLIEKMRRGRKRQAAPFAKTEPEKPRRRSWDAKQAATYGAQFHDCGPRPLLLGRGRRRVALPAGLSSRPADERCHSVVRQHFCCAPARQTGGFCTPVVHGRSRRQVGWRSATGSSTTGESDAPPHSRVRGGLLGARG